MNKKMITIDYEEYLKMVESEKLYGLVKQAEEIVGKFEWITRENMIENTIKDVAQMDKKALIELINLFGKVKIEDISVRGMFRE